ncbi:MAG: OmpA family protein [Candidatus Omnitrophica bacterium]|nr:OmpA family protein [Candidatus Omnitrophota bacterium]
MKSIVCLFAGILLISCMSSGCATYDKGRLYDGLKQDYIDYQGNAVREGIIKDDIIKKLRAQLEEKDRELAAIRADKDQALTVTQEKDAQISTLEEARARLAASLEKELQEYKAKLEMTDRGLVLTFLAEVFFDSGKDVIKEESKDALKKVAVVLNNNVASSNVAVEGHTDSDPIKYSDWKSNWELSVARALAVVHYFVDEAAVTAQRLSGVGYGEYRPVASNETPEGKKKNRRVEIVILPSNLKKVK